MIESIPLFSPLSAALAAVAAIGYLVGRIGGRRERSSLKQVHHELGRARQVAAELEKIVSRLRESIAEHHRRLNGFREMVDSLSAADIDRTLLTLCREADELLRPTILLAADLSAAEDELRRQGTNLASLGETRTDPTTGLLNRRAFDEALTAQMAMKNRYGAPFCVVLFDIDRLGRVNDRLGRRRGDAVLKSAGERLGRAARQTDIVARFDEDGFAVVMPQTELFGACIFAERMRAEAAQSAETTISGGVAEALDGDTEDSVRARAEEALNAAKAAGRNRIFCHDGEIVQPVCLEPVGAKGNF